MAQRALRTRRSWLGEEEGRGFEEAAPPGPVISVTIMPKGRCYRLARSITERLARVQGGLATPQPHITIQGVYDNADLAPIKERVAWVAATTAPFCVNVTGIGLLTSPSDPSLLYLHLHVEKSEELLDLYAHLKGELDALGLHTYAYSPEDWVPHLTLASGRWSRRELMELLQELEPELPVCVLPADEVQLNRLNGEKDWRCVARFPLTGVRAQPCR